MRIVLALAIAAALPFAAAGCGEQQAVMVYNRASTRASRTSSPGTTTSSKATR